ncbi:FMN-dependent NADH-azoreductase [Burkholderia stagnalis]|uniref:FMN-dependent NADH-azoreductase n=1 Tax=Burkholderia stagnalis TaxID=1503054 RepID=UPI00075F8379|nr:NAD(P)H-dependent oxidoreductase [Burkholderia stagnalis]KWK48274.1 FMN-dependent NADH-azoreductase [Burkholderia stagnalis]KWK54606.1 FMN-dependent NADH-azoreductase [Burkholderia stagnalis]KWN76318.1 FMN-dependent NADH-azoreductase [Burkholderia stagnalis]
MKILLINASPHGAASHGFRFADEIVDMLRARVAPGAAAIDVTERDLATLPLPPVARDYARAITSRTPDTAQFDLSEELIGEIEATDALIVNTPMHNFTVPAALKLWIDYVLRIHRTFASTPDGKVGLMRDRPTVVIVGSGGFHRGARARQPDFLTPYLHYALGSIGIRDVQFLLLQGLVAGEAAVAEALDTARAELAGGSVFAALAAHAAGRARADATAAVPGA